jgi:short-subunit dehydrogenase
MRKTILVTGASSGLGEGMAREFARRGRTVALCARRTARLDALKAELEDRYPACRVHVKALDVNDTTAVFDVFREFAAELGGLDRIVVNAGVGLGKRIGTGHADVNMKTAQTNFIAALAQCEAAVAIFRKQGSGHLVTIASMSALRGMPRHLTTYAATKAGLAALTEGIRAELLATPIKVSTMYPGYIRTELNEGAKKMLFEIDADTGSRLLVRAIEREPPVAFVPGWPWSLVGVAMRALPLSVVARMA